MLALLTLFLVSSGHAASDSKNPVSRYFRRVPIEQAHVTWGQSSSDRLPWSGLDVLVWNVKKGDKITFDAEFKKFGNDKDIFLIQEAYTAPFFTNTIATFRDYQWDLGLSFTYRLYNNEATGNMIGARVKPSWVKVEHTVDMEPLTATPKTTVYSKFPVEGSEKELLVISIHGINFANFEAYNRHLEQVKGYITSHDGPVVLAGDFNTRTKKRYRELQAFTKKLSLKEVRLINGDLRMVAVGTHNFLDHAFIKGFKVRHAEVFSSDGSDHQPMVLNLDFL
jgi:endonuclease/exonuclease/phosphatase (EEP) superfamily protein YafD